ncbi:MAG TPA: hypothetical protein VMM77_12875 [Gemmatimonadaceae bacterium]|nr:hypothetical protein [Gemmatimonadaceae bacterium]
MRTVLAQIEGARAVLDAAPLERATFDTEPPRAVDAEPVENATSLSAPVSGAPTTGFGAFLDGRQETRVFAWLTPIAPLVIGTVSAGIQRREGRRMHSWGPTVVERRVYAPLALLDAARLRRACDPLPVVETLTQDDVASGSLHPTLLQERARQSAMRDRELAEQRVAESWCQEQASPLFVDGGIAGSERLSASPQAIGVVKSHRTFYGDADGMLAALSLRNGERTRVVRIAPRGRSPVHSWYLRLRDPEGHDVLWGLVRVEVAESDDPAGRAELVSRWVMAERVPLAVPDVRWDRMAYGVRSVEQALGAAAPSARQA